MLKQALFSLTVGLLLVSSLALTSCDSPTGLGAASGAAGGAAIGALATHRLGGAIAGSAIGALTGALIGNAVEHDGAGAYGPPPRDGYPTAQPTDRKGLVISPYPPNHQIDVTDIPRGALVRDPSCDRLFVNP